MKTRADDTNYRIKTLVEHSAPSRTRPRLNDERELALEEVERVTAGCYAQMEDMKERVRRAREDILRGPPHDQQRKAREDG
jgi:hypothetical protein